MKKHTPTMLRSMLLNVFPTMFGEEIVTKPEILTYDDILTYCQNIQSTAGRNHWCKTL